MRDSSGIFRCPVAAFGLAIAGVGCSDVSHAPPDPVIAVSEENSVGFAFPATTPVSQLAFISAELGGQIYVFDITTSSVIDSIETTGATSRGIVYAPAGDVVYVALRVGSGGAVGRIDVPTKALTSVSVEPFPGVGTRDLSVTPDGRYLFASAARGNDLAVLETTDMTVIATITDVGSSPHGMAITPDGRRLYTAARFGTAIPVIDARSFRVLERIGIGIQTFDIALSPDGRRAFVGGMADRIVVLSTETNELIGEILQDGTSRIAVAVTSDGRHLVAGNGTDTALAVYDAETLARVGHVDAECCNDIKDIAVTDSRLYAVDRSTRRPGDLVGRLLVVDPSNWTFEEIPIGGSNRPFNVALPPSTADQVTFLSALVETLALEGALSRGMATALSELLTRVSAALAQGNGPAARGAITAFAAAVAGQVNGGNLPESVADQLIGTASRIAAVL